MTVSRNRKATASPAWLASRSCIVVGTIAALTIGIAPRGHGAQPPLQAVFERIQTVAGVKNLTEAQKSAKFCRILLDLGYDAKMLAITRAHETHTVVVCPMGRAQAVYNFADGTCQKNRSGTLKNVREVPGPQLFAAASFANPGRAQAPVILPEELGSGETFASR